MLCLIIQETVLTRNLFIYLFEDPFCSTSVFNCGCESSEHLYTFPRGHQSSECQHTSPNDPREFIMKGSMKANKKRKCNFKCYCSEVCEGVIHEVRCSILISKFTISGNPLAPEMPDITTFTVYGMEATSSLSQI